MQRTSVRFVRPWVSTYSRFFNHSASNGILQSGECEHTEEKPIPSSHRIPSRPHTAVDRIIRVSHAGEFAANRIYAGQAAVLGNSSAGPMIKVIAWSSTVSAHLIMHKVGGPDCMTSWPVTIHKSYICYNTVRCTCV